MKRKLEECTTFSLPFFVGHKEGILPRAWLEVALHSFCFIDIKIFDLVQQVWVFLILHVLSTAIKNLPNKTKPQSAAIIAENRMLLKGIDGIAIIKVYNTVL